MVGGRIWRRRLHTLLGAGLHQHGCHQLPIHSLQKDTYRRTSILLTLIMVHLELKALLQKLNQHKVRAMADIVTNYRVGTTRGHGGAYNQYDRIPLSWNEHSVTSCCGELSSLLISMYRSTGDNFHGVPNIDHTQAFVWKDIIGWLKWLLKSIGFQDFRFDFAKGYAPKFVKEYVEESKPMFSVGEYWDTCNYSPDYCLDYNQGQTISASMTTQYWQKLTLGRDGLEKI